jgi:hypothetical protein
MKDVAEGRKIDAAQLCALRRIQGRLEDEHCCWQREETEFRGAALVSKIGPLPPPQPDKGAVVLLVR